MEELDFDDDDILVFGESMPYQFEPQYSAEEVKQRRKNAEAAKALSLSRQAEDRTSNTNWCSCSNCICMPLSAECLCCDELPQIKSLLDTTECSCITQLDDFNAHIHPSVLETYFKLYHKKSHGRGRTLSNRQYHLVAYRLVLDWVSEEVPANCNGITMPACIIDFIRRKFPSSDGHYASFKWPSPEEL